MTRSGKGKKKKRKQCCKLEWVRYYHMSQYMKFDCNACFVSWLFFSTWMILYDDLGAVGSEMSGFDRFPIMVVCVCVRSYGLRMFSAFVWFCVWYHYRIECALKLILSKTTLLPACQIPHFTSKIVHLYKHFWMLKWEKKRRREREKKITRWKL